MKYEAFIMDIIDTFIERLIIKNKSNNRE
jgi:hypothetical protein